MILRFSKNPWAPQAGLPDKVDTEVPDSEGSSMDTGPEGFEHNESMDDNQDMCESDIKENNEREEEDSSSSEADDVASDLNDGEYHPSCMKAISDLN